jgi:plasmid maintenance system antidote protein VapI
MIGPPTRVTAGQGESEKGAVVADSYHPGYRVPPGETISECLTALALDVESAAARMIYAPGDLKGVIADSAPISPALAAGLECVLGPPASFWINLDRRFQAYR